MSSPIPTGIKLRKAPRTLELEYADGTRFSLPAEFLRVHSPSAAVQGHCQQIMQAGTQHVALVGLEPAGDYALRLLFDAGRDSGMCSWDSLRRLGQDQDRLWQEYLDRLHQAGASGAPDVSVVRIMP